MNCFNFRTIHILIEQATFLLHCFMYTLAFVDKIIIKPKCPRNVKITLIIKMIVVALQKLIFFMVFSPVISVL